MELTPRWSPNKNLSLAEGVQRGRVKHRVHVVHANARRHGAEVPLLNSSTVRDLTPEQLNLLYGTKGR
jgi:hypothetical protein